MSTIEKVNGAATAGKVTAVDPNMLSATLTVLSDTVAGSLTPSPSTSPAIAGTDTGGGRVGEWTLLGVPLGRLADAIGVTPSPGFGLVGNAEVSNRLGVTDGRT